VISPGCELYVRPVVKQWFSDSCMDLGGLIFHKTLNSAPIKQWPIQSPWSTSDVRTERVEEERHLVFGDGDVPDTTLMVRVIVRPVG